MGFFFSSEATTTNLGPATAQYTMAIQYCGGWGYLKYANEIQAQVDAKYPEKFNYVFNKDAGTTGNLEVEVYLNNSQGTKV